MPCRSLASLTLALSLAACFAGENPEAGGAAALAAAREQVEQRLNSYLQIPITGRVDEIAGFWTADGKIFESEVAMTASELPALAADFLAANSLTAVKLTPVETVAHDGGNTVYVFGHSTETMQPRDGRTPASTVRCQVMIRWVRGADGEYRIQKFLAVPIAADAEPLVAAAVEVPAPARAIDERLARQQVDQRMKDYIAITRTSDPVAMMTYWADDARLFEPATQYGSKSELSQALEGLLATNRVASLNVSITDIFVHDQGSVAYQFGNYEEIVEAKDGRTAPMTVRNNFAVRWRRGDDDVWRIDRFLATPQPKPAEDHAH